MRARRSVKLIVDFKIIIPGKPQYTLTKGWIFCLPSSFRDALDIKYQKRVKDKKPYWTWTQGRLFSFSEGDIIYDCPEAYFPSLNWNEQLQLINQMVQVHSATPAGYDKKKGEKEYYPGTIWFKTYRPNAERTELIEAESHSCTQVDFVEFLKTGKIPIPYPGLIL